ncbi:putative E3 ubiquitin-protein ligase RING1a isoform X2 [Prunus dulcis]|uniref:putative E3 ubiquitin-protein ligase RING1a isoform X2 n=1 Tax=Prunus dulcis TaxID=3755 RepID=UPI00148255A5|nr:putative E3 ubiquitin-protein ligase RING1a isoform X2 [Prunus dulcis]
MDNVSSQVCLKSDSQSEVLDKDTAMVPLNNDTPIIGGKTEESMDWKDEEPEDEEPEDEEPKDEESEDEEPEDEESEDGESEDGESETWKSEVEESDDEKSKDGKSYEGECKYCLKVDKHPTQLCSYRYRVPKNAIVGESCVVECLVCGCLFRDSCCASCGLSIGRAVLKECTICGKQEEHSNFECPEREEKRKDSGFTYDPYTGSFSVEIRPLK